MSFDECLQLLAETFPVEGTEVRLSDISTILIAYKMGVLTHVTSHRMHQFAWTHLLFRCLPTATLWCPLSRRLCHQPTSPHVSWHHHREWLQIWSRPGWSFCPSLSCRYSIWSLTLHRFIGLCCITNTQRMYELQDPGFTGQIRFYVRYESRGLNAPHVHCSLYPD